MSKQLIKDYNILKTYLDDPVFPLVSFDFMLHQKRARLLRVMYYTYKRRTLASVYHLANKVDLKEEFPSEQEMLEFFERLPDEVLIKRYLG